MHMLLALAVILLAMLAASDAQARVTAVEGDARDPDGGRLLYREEHLIRHEGERPLERLVIYRCPDGSAFARKRVDYRVSQIAPDFELVDARGYREGLRREGGQPVLWSTESRARRLGAAKAPLVADAGFDEYLRQRWTTFADGRPQPIAFAVPSFGRALPLRIRSAGRHQRAGTPVYRFELSLDGLLGAFADAIAVEYDAGDRRLRHFRGLTNVRDADGDQIEAAIDFPRAPRVVDAARWQSLASMPLARCTLGR
jgi:hypothetical protein